MTNKKKGGSTSNSFPQRKSTDGKRAETVIAIQFQRYIIRMKKLRDSIL